jgi:DNA-binding ferritin-like protein
MHSIATLLRALQLFAHRAHNDVRGDGFFADHKFFGKIYGEYEEAFDSVIERMIGLGEKTDIVQINSDACADSSKLPNNHDAKRFFAVLIKSEENLCALIKKAVPQSTDGTQNLLQGIADASEARLYLMKQRVSA